MGKLLGLFFGFLVFGHVGSFVGLIIGFIFDSKVKFFKYNFFSEESYSENEIIVDAFPLMCAEIVRSNTIDKNSIFIVKDIAIDVFGKNTAKSIMEQFKEYIETGYSDTTLQSVCENVKFSLDSNTKANIINLLFRIIKSRGGYSKSEIDAIKKIAEYIGININPFGSTNNNERFYGYYENYNHYNYNSGGNNNFTSIKDYYKILEIDNSASDEEIKKQYRNLCKKYHPDVVTHLPDSEKKVSEEKMKEIIDAYEEIKKERGIK